MTPSLLPAVRPMMSVPRRTARDAFADRDDHFIGSAEAVGFVDDREPVDRGDEIGAVAVFRFRRFDGARKLLAQARAVEMAREFVARGEIGQPLRFALVFGDDAQDAGQPFGAPSAPGHAHAAHLEPHRTHRGRRLEFAFEGRSSTQLLIMASNCSRPWATSTPAQLFAALQAIDIRVKCQHVQPAVPGDAVVADHPVEHDLVAPVTASRRRSASCSDTSARMPSTGFLRSVLLTTTPTISRPFPAFSG